MLPPLNRRRAKEIGRLRRRRAREEAGQYLIEGVRLVESAVLAGAPLLEIVASEEALAEPRVQAFLRRTDAPVYRLPAAELERLADTRSPQGIVAVGPIRRGRVAEIGAPVVALDAVQDPGNVGAIIRTAAWFGAAAVVVGPDSADPFGPKAARAAMGGLWDLQIAAADDLPRALEQLRQRGLRLYGADLEGADARGWRPARQGVLVIGSEARGLQPAVAARLDERVRVGGGHGRRGVESLNAAVAAGILIHHWLG